MGAVDGRHLGIGPRTHFSGGGNRDLLAWVVKIVIVKTVLKCVGRISFRREAGSKNPMAYKEPAQLHRIVDLFRNHGLASLPPVWQGERVDAVLLRQPLVRIERL